MSQQDESQRPTAEGQAVVAPATESGFGVAIRRNGRLVEITLLAANDYAGMQLYDMLVRSIQDGCLRLGLKTSGTAPGAPSPT